MRLRSTGLAVLFAAMLVPEVCVAQQTRWIVAPYLWATDVGWDIASRGGGGVAFSDLIDKVDGAGLIRVEYAVNRFGVMFDYIGMSLSDRRRIQTPGPLPVDINIRASLDMDLIEAGAFWRPSGTDSGVDVLAGFRAADIGSYAIFAPVNTEPQRFNASTSFVDLYAGARYLHRLTESWDFAVRGDYGFGGTNGAINLGASVGWRSRGTFGMMLSYRYLSFDVNERIAGERATNKFDFSGPALGFLFRF